jgi:hypothetical protein
MVEVVAMHRAKGILRYSPKLLGERVSDKWWLVLDVHQDLSNLYRHLFWLNNHRCRKLQKPAWGAHVSVLRNEEPPDEKKHLWEKYADQEIEFEYTTFVGNNGEHWWLPVICEELLDIRTEMGLPRDPYYPLHLTFGVRVRHDT